MEADDRRLSGKRENLKGVVLIMDIRRPPEVEEEMLIEFLASLEIPVVVALTKVDKLSGNERARQLKLFKKGMDGVAIPFSATTGKGRTSVESYHRVGRGLNIPLLVIKLIAGP